MDNKFFMYVNNTSEDAKLVYTLELLCLKINSKLNTFFEKSGLDIFKFNFLMILKNYDNGEGIEEKEIIDRLLVIPSYTTRFIDELLSAKLITINKIDDKRMIKITDKAVNLLDELYFDYQNVIEIITNNMKDDDKILIRTKLLDWLISIF